MFLLETSLNASTGQRSLLGRGTRDEMRLYFLPALGRRGLADFHSGPDWLAHPLTEGALPEVGEGSCGHAPLVQTPKGSPTRRLRAVSQ